MTVCQSIWLIITQEKMKYNYTNIIQQAGLTSSNLVIITWSGANAGNIGLRQEYIPERTPVYIFLFTGNSQYLIHPLSCLEGKWKKGNQHECNNQYANLLSSRAWVGSGAACGCFNCMLWHPVVMDTPLKAHVISTRALLHQLTCALHALRYYIFWSLF